MNPYAIPRHYEVEKPQAFGDKRYLPTSDALEAFVLLNPNVGLLNVGKVVVRRDYNQFDGVKVIGGGCSGQEPAYCGFVGKGMLSAAIHGELTTAPNVSEILTTIREITHKTGSSVFVIIQDNLPYCLNFGLAIERARNEGIIVHFIELSDLVKEKGKSKYTGSSGVLLLYKIAGAMAEKKGTNVKEVHNFCQSVAENLITEEFKVKVCPQGNCTCSKSSDKKKSCVDEETLKKTMEEFSKIGFVNSFKLTPQTSVVLLINNMGASSKIEEMLFTRELLRQLHEANIQVLRAYSGKYLSKLNESGYSVSVLKVENPKVIALLDEPTEACWWIRNCINDLKPNLHVKIPLTLKQQHLKFSVSKGPRVNSVAAEITTRVVNLACNALISCEKQLNTMDPDSELGTSIRRGAEVIKSISSTSHINMYPYNMLIEFSKVVETSIGGMTGSLYSILFDSAAKKFGKMKENDAITAAIWFKALAAGVESLTKYVNLLSEDSTIGPLLACVAVLQKETEKTSKTDLDTFGLGVSAAEERAKLKDKNKKYPDAGAHAVGIWLRALYEGLKLSLV